MLNNCADAFGEMFNNLNNVFKRIKVILIGLFLSRCDKDELKNLGLDLDSFNEAFRVLGEINGLSPNSIKTCKYRFDSYFKNLRDGEIRKLPNDYQEIIDATGNLTDEEFQRLIVSLPEIDNEEWKSIVFEGGIRSFFDTIEDGKNTDEDTQNWSENQFPNEEGMNDVQEWHITGNIKDFISAEKKYKDSFRRLLSPTLPDWTHAPQPEEEQRFYETELWLERWLPHSIIVDDNSNETYQQFINAARSTLKIARYIVPTSSELRPVIDELDNTHPEHNVTSCICFHSAMMNVCNLIHLHRKPEKYKTAFMLLKKAEKYLGFDPFDKISDIAKLIRLSIINWEKEPITALHNQILGRSIISCPMSTVAFEALELSIPLARYAYKTNGAKHQAYIKLNFSDVGLSNGYYIKDGEINLPFSLNGYIADCPQVGRCVVAFRGSNTFWNFITDATQLLVGVSLVYKMALGLLLELKEKWNDKRFWVIGHSLGGGLTQFAVAGINNSNFIGFGYNSAGLSDIATAMLMNRNCNNIFHLHLKNDEIFLVGNQLGSYCDQQSVVEDKCEAHKIATMERKSKNRIESLYFSSLLRYYLKRFFYAGISPM